MLLREPNPLDTEWRMGEVMAGGRRKARSEAVLACWRRRGCLPSPEGRFHPPNSLQPLHSQPCTPGHRHWGRLHRLESALRPQWDGAWRRCPRERQAHLLVRASSRKLGPENSHGSHGKEHPMPLPGSVGVRWCPLADQLAKAACQMPTSRRMATSARARARHLIERRYASAAKAY